MTTPLFILLLWPSKLSESFCHQHDIMSSVHLMNSAFLSVHLFSYVSYYVPFNNDDDLYFLGLPPPLRFTFHHRTGYHPLLFSLRVLDKLVTGYKPLRTIIYCIFFAKLVDSFNDKATWVICSHTSYLNVFNLLSISCSCFIDMCVGCRS